MISRFIGTQSIGLRLPFLREGDGEKLINNIVSCYRKADPQDGDIIGVTESIVARCFGFYVNYDEIGEWIKNFKPSADTLVLYNPIFSRNRFVPILQGFLRNDNIKKVVVVSLDEDEVGNLVNHQITGVNYKDLYQSIVEESGREFEWNYNWNSSLLRNDTLGIDCRLHADISPLELRLSDICNDKSSWGLLGMNYSNGERLKLFPDRKFCEGFVLSLQNAIRRDVGVDVEVMVYGDGAYKDPQSHIWEWADPVVSPAWTKGLNGYPTELKLKASLDAGKSDEEIQNDIMVNRNEGGQALGTTPRRIVDLLGSLMDLTSGSGDKGTPVVIVRDYFKKYVE